ncbi:MAG: hypothetical protein NC924_01645 [Candidatus Omnitrophica bacterium]|nr:hypothetical protein [Candidatus Omnitrophota bacterium]
MRRFLRAIAAVVAGVFLATDVGGTFSGAAPAVSAATSYLAPQVNMNSENFLAAVRVMSEQTAPAVTFAAPADAPVSTEQGRSGFMGWMQVLKQRVQEFLPLWDRSANTVAEQDSGPVDISERMEPLAKFKLQVQTAVFDRVEKVLAAAEKVLPQEKLLEVAIRRWALDELRAQVEGSAMFQEIAAAARTAVMLISNNGMGVVWSSMAGSYDTRSAITDQAAEANAAAKQVLSMADSVPVLIVEHAVANLRTINMDTENNSLWHIQALEAIAPMITVLNEQQDFYGMHISNGSLGRNVLYRFLSIPSSIASPEDFFIPMRIINDGDYQGVIIARDRTTKQFRVIADVSVVGKHAVETEARSVHIVVDRSQFHHFQTQVESEAKKRYDSLIADPAALDSPLVVQVLRDTAGAAALLLIKNHFVDLRNLVDSEIAKYKLESVAAVIVRQLREDIVQARSHDDIAVAVYTAGNAFKAVLTYLEESKQINNDKQLVKDFNTAWHAVLKMVSGSPQLFVQSFAPAQKYVAAFTDETEWLKVRAEVEVFARLEAVLISAASTYGNDSELITGKRELLSGLLAELRSATDVQEVGIIVATAYRLFADKLDERVQSVFAKDRKNFENVQGAEQLILEAAAQYIAAKRADEMPIAIKRLAESVRLVSKEDKKIEDEIHRELTMLKPFVQLTTSADDPLDVLTNDLIGTIVVDDQSHYDLVVNIDQGENSIDVLRIDNWVSPKRPFWVGMVVSKQLDNNSRIWRVNFSLDKSAAWDVISSMRSDARVKYNNLKERKREDTRVQSTVVAQSSSAENVKSEAQQILARLAAMSDKKDVLEGLRAKIDGVYDPVDIMALAEAGRRVAQSNVSSLNLGEFLDIERRLHALIIQVAGIIARERIERMPSALETLAYAVQKGNEADERSARTMLQQFAVSSKWESGDVLTAGQWNKTLIGKIIYDEVHYLVIDFDDGKALLLSMSLDVLGYLYIASSSTVQKVGYDHLRKAQLVNITQHGNAVNALSVRIFEKAGLHYNGIELLNQIAAGAQAARIKMERFALEAINQAI